MHAAAACFDLHVPASRSLKTKRAAIRPIVDGLRHRFPVSVAEVDHQNQWQRAAIGVAVVGSSVTQVREVFGIPRIGKVAGCFVAHGTITRGSKVRFLREGTVIWKGAISSLRRFKDDVREVREGFECGVGLENYSDLKPGDIIETFEEREIARV